MKNLFLKISLLIFFLNYSGILFAKNADTEIRTIYAKNDSSISYELFIPGIIQNNLKTKPVFFFFEPWGNGYYPVNKYKALAEKYDVALIGFNSSRNGISFEESTTNFNIAIKDLINVYELNPNQVCLVGFSGGGKVALKVSSEQPLIPYVVYGGSAIEASLSGKDILGFAGTTDMNYIDLINYDASLNSIKNIRHSIIEYNGAHSWFDTTTMENAFIWLKLNLIRNQNLPNDTTFIQTLTINYMHEIDDFVLGKKWLNAYKLITKVNYFLNGLIDIKWLDEKMETVAKTSAYKKETKQEQFILDLEKQTKSNYFIYLFSRDSTWWKTEIERLNGKNSNLQMQSNQRLLGCIFTYCYYFTNDAFQQNNLITAEKILTIFHLAFPKNEEQAFLRAVLWAKKNNPDKSDELFYEAKKLGFNEWDKSPNETILQYFKRRPLK